MEESGEKFPDALIVALMFLTGIRIKTYLTALALPALGPLFQ
jgi:uncharacterized membrane protein YdjX (TVP38/TMEM64 family)